MSKQLQILLVEDDATLGEVLLARLEKDYSIRWVRSKTEALQVLRQGVSPELLILDVGLPDGTGFEIAESLQSPKPALLFLTAQGDAESRLRGYELGAEEYIPKPFHLKELLLRVQHVLQEHAPQAPAAVKKVQLENCQIDFDSQSIRASSGLIDYPPVNDMKVLQFLMEQSPRVVSRDEIMNQVWGVDKNPSIRTIDNTIVRIRQVLGEPAEKHIRSVRGIGYQWLEKFEADAHE